MKKVIQKEIVEEICDICRKSNKNIDATISFNFSYGSNRDLQNGTLDFCSDCAEFLLADIKEKFPFFQLKENYDYSVR